MSVCRVRLGRDFPESGRFEWALVNELGSVLESGVSDLAMPPRGRPCEAVLAAELVLLERVSLPAAQQRRLQSALRFLAEDSIVPDPARVHVAAARTPQKDVVCVGVVDREWFTQALARDLAPDGIRVNAIAPGVIATPMTASTREDPNRLAGFMTRTPLGRVGQPEELIGPVIFLASSMASYVNGAILPVDGGYLAA